MIGIRSGAYVYVRKFPYYLIQVSLALNITQSIAFIYEGKELNIKPDARQEAKGRKGMLCFCMSPCLIHLIDKSFSPYCFVKARENRLKN